MKTYRHSREGGNLALFTYIKQWIAVFGIVMMFAVSGLAAVLDSDTFNTNTDGWTGTNVVWNSGSGGQLFMNRDQAASKTFNLGAGYANAAVTVTLNTTEIGGWESDDVTVIIANGSTVYNSNVSGNISFNATLNGSGQLVVSVMPNTNNNSEDLYMDDFVIDFSPPEIEIDGFPHNSTDSSYGNVDINGETVTKTYTIRNTGSGTLTIGSMGTSATEFPMTGVIPASSVPPGGTTTFSITFNPNAIGTRTGRVAISNNDPDESLYYVYFSGNGINPEIEVDGVVDNGTDTSFGTTGVASGTIDKTYTIRNLGATALSIGTVSATGDFSVISQPSSSIGSGLSSTFIVRFDPSASGVRNGTITFSNNDYNENPYNFSISGTGANPPVLMDSTKTVPENSPGGTNVGTPLVATENPTSYTITGGSGSALFDINASSGQISVKSAAVLDYETIPTYSLLVKPSNEAGDGNEANITINLTDVLVPVITPGQSYTLKTGTPNGTVVGTVATTVATPSDFNITGSVFAISDTGVITVADSSGLVVGTSTYTVGASTSEGGDSKPITIVVTQRISDLELANTDSKDPVITDETYSYTVGVYNAGPDEATDVVLVDTLPAGVTFISAVGMGWSCNESGGYVTCTRPTLTTVHANSNVVITVKAPSIGGVITNSATVTSSGLDPVPFTNTDVEQETTVEAKADLRIVKTAPASAATNNTIQYSLKITNLGPSVSNDVNVSDILPAGLVFNNAYAVANDWICSYDAPSRKISCTHPTTLETNVPSEIVLVVTAPSTVPSPANIVNTATVTGPLIDPVTTNNSSSATTTITASSFSSSNERPFALQKNYNINGNMKIIGNSMLLKSDGGCAGTGTDNNDIDTTWADRDTDTTTWNSSSADLALPKGVNSSKIKYAGLVWQGRVDSDNDDAAFWAAAKTIKFKAPGLAYQTLTSSDAKYNWTLRSSDANYQGAVEVTNILKQSIDTVSPATIASTGFSGTFWGANVQAEKMKNGFGAWALVIVYEDQADTLKNISVYDGYVSVDNGETIPTTLSGFLTPSSGPVASSFLIFAGEGDVTLTDSVTLSNSLGDQSLGSNIFNSSETINGNQVTSRDPSCQNTIGIDIDTFNVGTSSTTPIIKNNQTSTTVKLKSTGDVYYPGTFAFSTELYVPNVCYDEQVYYNGQLVSSTNMPVSGQKVDYVVTIKNQDAEDADGVFVEKVFDTPNQISYATNSMQVAPIGGTFSSKTDKVGDDTAEYANATAKFLLGYGAQWYTGGKIQQYEETKFRYKAKIGDQNVSESGYKMSYRNDLLHLTFNGISAPKCTDFNNSFVIVIPPLPAGVFDAWESTISGTPPETDSRQIYTKIANTTASLTVGAMNGADDAYQNYTTGLVGWRFVNESTCPTGDDSITSWSDINLSVVNPNTITFTPIEANQNVKIQFAQKQVDGNYSLTNRNCSNDNFAIRPNNFDSNITANQKFIAGAQTSIVFRANKSGGVGTVGYNELESSSFVVDINISDNSKTCQDMNISFSPDINFTNGEISDVYTLNNVGDFNLTIQEKNGGFASADCNTNPEYAYVDCDDTDDALRLITPFNTQIKVIPDHFTLDGNFTNGSNGFTYFNNFDSNASLDQNISALLDVNITAKAFDDATTMNYTSNCYAKDGNLSLGLTIPVIEPAGNLSKVLWYDDFNTTNKGSFNIGAFGTSLGYTAAQFSVGDTNGTANVRYRLNFDRNETMLVNPFTMIVNEVNATENSIDLVDGNATLTTNNSAYYVYGRVIPRDIRVFGANKPFTANAWYEVYKASSINDTLLPISKNDTMWYTNIWHGDIMPNYDGDANVTYINAAQVNIGGFVGVDGMEDYSFGNIYGLGGYRAHIHTNPWLWYGINASPYQNPSGANLDCLTHPCFNINIVNDIGRAGSATSETLKDEKINKESNRGVGISYDYTPAIQ